MLNSSLFKVNFLVILSIMIHLIVTIKNFIFKKKVKKPIVQQILIQTIFFYTFLFQISSRIDGDDDQFYRNARP